MRILKQSTASTLLLGPFLDETDGKTAETALTLSQADILLWKEGGTSMAQKNESTTCTHRSAGYYTCPVNTTDTNTLGTLVVTCAESGALPIRQDYLVVVANVFDSYCSTDLLQVDVQELGGSVSALGRQRQAALAMLLGTSDNTGFTATTTVMDTDITEATADHYNGRTIVFTSGALAQQACRIQDYALTSGRGRFTFSDALTEAVPNGTTFVIV